MPKLSETAQRILANLEEAHAENISSTMNTIFRFPLKGDSVELLDTKAALVELINERLVRLAVTNPKTRRYDERSVEDSSRIAADLENRVAFSTQERIWKWDRSFEIEEIVTTDAGLAEARRLLDERGYEWWTRG